MPHEPARPDQYRYVEPEYQHAPIRVRAGERIRVWTVDAGPQYGTSFHVVGTQFDTGFKHGATGVLVASRR